MFGSVIVLLPETIETAVFGAIAVATVAGETLNCVELIISETREFAVKLAAVTRRPLTRLAVEGTVITSSPW